MEPFLRPAAELAVRGVPPCNQRVGEVRQEFTKTAIIFYSMMKTPSQNNAVAMPWRSVLAARPSHETAEEKTDTAKWLIRVVPTVGPREQHAIWQVLWTQYRVESCDLLVHGYVQLYSPAYRTVLRASGVSNPPRPAEGAHDLPPHLLARIRPPTRQRSSSLRLQN